MSVETETERKKRVTTEMSMIGAAVKILHESDVVSNEFVGIIISDFITQKRYLPNDYGLAWLNEAIAEAIRVETDILVPATT